jgi:hypothetical protein
MQINRQDLLRLIALGLATVLESAAFISVVLRLELLPLGTFYRYVISVAAFVLPTVVGLVAQRLEVAVLLAILPVWLFGIVYLAIYAPVWTIDLVQIGPLVSASASYVVLFGALGLLGWLLRRLILRQAISAERAAK